MAAPLIGATHACGEQGDGGGAVSAPVPSATARELARVTIDTDVGSSLSFQLLNTVAVSYCMAAVWTLGRIALLQRVKNNILAPLVYGERTGLSSPAVLLSAVFRAALWGPIGLVLAMPLTVCLVVIGRHLAPLRFLDMLLSSEPVFDDATQLYHR